VYFRVLPGIDFGSGVSAGSDPPWTWNAHDGSRGTGAGSAVDGAAGCWDWRPVASTANIDTTSTILSEVIALLRL
jgi:hypothetical protein